MKYLVTGGAGFIGSNLCNILIEQGHRVRSFDNYSRGNPNRLHKEVEQVKGDITNYEDIFEAVKGCDSVIHAAYVQGTQTFYSNPKDVLEIALGGMLNLLNSMIETGELILISSSETYQTDNVPTDETVPLGVPDSLNPRFSYGGGKIACELMLTAWAENGFLDRAIIVRPHNIYGPDMGNEHVIPMFINRMNELVRKYPENPILFKIQGSGKETRSFCYISDFIEQFNLVLQKGEHRNIYHLGSEDEREIGMLANIISNIYGRRIEIMPSELPKGSPKRRCPSIHKIIRLGYNGNKVGLTGGLRETIKWYENT